MGFTGFRYLQYYLSVLYRYNCGILPQFLKGNRLVRLIGANYATKLTLSEAAHQLTKDFEYGEAFRQNR